MSFIARVRNLVRGLLARWIGRREHRNPEAVYEAAIEERLSHYAALRAAAAGVLYMRSKLTKELELKSGEHARVQRQLAAAVDHDDDAVAVALIGRRDLLGQDIERVSGELRQLTEEAEAAKTNLVTFHNEIARLREEKVRMLARLANARARLRLQEALSGLSPDADIRALEGVRDHINRLVTEAQLSRDLGTRSRASPRPDPRSRGRIRCPRPARRVEARAQAVAPPARGAAPRALERGLSALTPGRRRPHPPGAPGARLLHQVALGAEFADHLGLSVPASTSDSSARPMASSAAPTRSRLQWQPKRTGPASTTGGGKPPSRWPRMADASRPARTSSLGAAQRLTFDSSCSDVADSAPGMVCTTYPPAARTRPSVSTYTPTPTAEGVCSESSR